MGCIKAYQNSIQCLMFALVSFHGSLTSSFSDPIRSRRKRGNDHMEQTRTGTRCRGILSLGAERQRGLRRIRLHKYGSVARRLLAHAPDGCLPLGRRLGALLIDAHDLVSGSWIICMHTSINGRMSYGRAKVDPKRLFLKAPRIHGCRGAQGGGGDSWSHREGRPSRRRLEASARAT